MTDSFKFDANVPAFVPRSSAIDSKGKTITPGLPDQPPPRAPKNRRGTHKARSQPMADGQRKQPRSHKANGGGNTLGRGNEQPTGNNYDLDNFIDEAELMRTGRNKRGHVSLTHLLEFADSGLSNGPGSYDFRRSNGGRRTRTDTGNGNNGGLYSVSSKHPPADKTTYINTTCRFVMDPRNSEIYEPLLVDPDIPVPMEKVMRILSRPAACPICLEDVPKAPRMLRCGHIMCLPCLLRFIDSVQKPQPPVVNTGFSTQQPVLPKKPTPVECPLCSERIKIEHVKPVSFILFDERFELPREDQDVVMKLMFRPMGEANSVPVSAVQGGEISRAAFVEMPVMHGDDTGAAQFSRLVKASLGYLTKEFEVEIRGLQSQMEEEQVMYQDDSLTKFHTQAISKVRKAVYDTNEVFEHVQAEEIAHELTAAALHEDLLVNFTDYDDNTAYYYYQTSFQSEIKYFLSPLDVKILRAEYGVNYSRLPSSIVVRADNIVFSNYVNEELRKRLKYMTNIPAGTQVAFVECKWTEDTLSGVTLQKFRKELGRRRRLKADKTQRENTMAQRIERQEKSLLREDLLRESGVDIGSGTPAGVSSFSMKGSTGAGDNREGTNGFAIGLSDGPPLPSVRNSGGSGNDGGPNGGPNGDSDGALAEEEGGGGSSSSIIDGHPRRIMKKTVWGTRVPEDARITNNLSFGGGSDGEYYEGEGGRDYSWADFSALNDTVREIGESKGRQSRKNRKKVLLSSTSGGR